MSPLHVVLVGYGPVGARFVEEILPGVRTGAVALTVLAGEDVEAYNRVLVAEYAVGNTELDAMFVGDRETAEEAGARVLLGVDVTAVDRAARTVALSTGETLAYDRLVLATGARANVPTLDGIERHRRDLASLEKYGAQLVARDDDLPAGITALRDLADAERVLEAVRARRRIIVLGAGVLGLELALAAAHAGAQVCVVHHGPHPMPRNLDRGGGHVLRSALRRTGIQVIAHSRAEAVAFRTGEDGERRFDMLVTADGKQIRGDLLVLSCGVSPRTELAVLAGLRTASGVVVHPSLASWTDPAIFAIGDCAQVVERTEELARQRTLPGAPSGLIAPGWRQAAWLAGSFLDEAVERPTSATPPVEREPLVMLKAEHIDVVAVGDLGGDPFDDDALHPRRRVSQWADPEHLRYVKMVTEDGVLTGFASVGMPRTAAELTLLFERGGELPADRSILLRFDGPDYDPAADADAFAPATTVCWCNAVTVGRIEESAACGNTTVECVGRDTRAGTGCGGCRGRIAEVLARVGDPDGEPTLTV
ncbi:assimilatory nitrate reductase electron transfer subunit [Agromyces terreus]|uniref:Assimilatory nitrate reductase electron transfer subunit n=1 Tax=Agromyces terreus TaxID=424795 RepID=A0A9X2H7J8_9MICO|nr:FAD-dependent oxidoreductase [Agromyces terreus]MCP2372227.1 assimilatory nitrate reductase electron transfer subunit [Agromyces terreus]